MRRVLVITNNLAQASFRLRIQELVPGLRAAGFELDVQVRPRGILRRRALLRASREYHCVILQRKLLDPADIRLLRRHSRRIIYDIDDAVMLEQRPTGAIARWRNTRRFHATADAVDHVVAGNEYLAEFFRQRGKPVTILPTVVDPAHYGVKVHEPTNNPRLVWIGSHSTIPYVENFLPAIEAARRQIAGLSLVIIADATITRAPIPVEFVAWSAAMESGALLRGDIGVAPTPDDPWTRGKCGFKIVQYLASGLPVIASPVGANAKIVTEDCGILATTMEEWTEGIVRLAKDVSLRAAMGERGRRRVEEEYSLKHAAAVWAQLLGE